MKLRFRQIHLDFHTSEHIRDVGKDFSRENFQKALTVGHVDSITVFSKCHHGLTYHDTKVGVKHPYLVKPLLPLMIEAAREINVNTPVYLSAGLDEMMSQRHPEWRVQWKGNAYNPFAAGYKCLCFNTPYLDYLCAQIDEVLTMFKTNGLFLDIIAMRKCYCPTCIAGMLAEGLDPENDEHVNDYQMRVLMKYYEKTTATVRKHGKDIPLFHNSGHISRGDKRIIPFQTHLELESLPTGGWGYDHFPLSARYAITTGMEFLGMTGKFHTTWGEFGGYKHPNALRYEAAAMTANGAKCSVGDQLHPSGAMDMDTYECIGAAYKEVKANEEYCDTVSTASTVAVLSVESLGKGISHHSATPFADEGAVRALLESHVMFDVIDTAADLSKYKVLILPDAVVLDDTLAEKVNSFMKAGGMAIASGTSGMDSDKKKFLIATKLSVKGESPWTNDYIAVRDALADDMVKSPFVTYAKAQMTDPKGAEVLADAWQPYFNRTYAHFCSHQHTPYEKKADYPAVVRDGNLIYFAHPIFSMYRTTGQRLYRMLIRNALRLAGAMTVESTLPSTARISFMEQKGRHILHVLNGAPVKRGGEGEGRLAKAIEVIEEIVPLHDVRMTLAVGKAVTRVRTADGKTVAFTADKGKITFTLPVVEHHAIMIIE
ncbi:MAG: alpha-amylase family protein [Spirochaetota bacterium]